MTQFQAAAPVLVEAAIDEAGKAAELKVRCRQQAGKNIVVFHLPALIERIEADLQCFIETVRQTQAERAVAVGVIVGIGAETVSGGVDAGCLVQAAPR